MAMLNAKKLKKLVKSFQKRFGRLMTFEELRKVVRGVK